MYVVTLFVETEEMPKLQQELVEIGTIVGENGLLFRLVKEGIRQSLSDGELDEDD